MQTALPAIEEVAKFHGHLCPGLAIGYQAARLALGWLEGNRSEDEEVVAIVENRACGIDAIQYVLGTTAGKGNFFIRDYGKHVYTVANRATGLGVRIATLPKGRWRREGETKAETVQRLLATPPEELFAVTEEAVDLPQPAEVLESLTCAACGEGAMETRVRHYHGEVLCIPCFERKSAQAAE